MENLLEKTEENYSEKEYNKYCWLLIIICIGMYTLMFAAKNILSSEMVDIIEFFKTDKATISMANTYYYITYAAVQLALVVILPKIKLKWYLSITMIFSAIVTTMIAFITKVEHLWIIYAVNGVLQAGLYASCMFIFSKNLPSRLLPTVNKILSAASVGANMISYALSALFVDMGRWDLTYIVLGGFYLLSTIVFTVLYSYTLRKMKQTAPKITAIKEVKREESAEEDIVNLDTKKNKIIFYILISFLSFFGNTLYFSIMNWFPSMLYDVFGVPKSMSIFITLFVPPIILMGNIISVNKCERHKRIYEVAVVFYVASAVIMGVAIFVFSLNVILSIAIMLAFLIIANGARTIFSGITAFKMRNKINTGSYSAYINAIASIAAGVMPTVIGKIIDSAGWQVSYIVVLAMNVALLVCIFLLLSLCGVKKCPK